MTKTETLRIIRLLSVMDVLLLSKPAGSVPDYIFEEIGDVNDLLTRELLGDPPPPT